MNRSALRLLGIVAVGPLGFLLTACPPAPPDLGFTPSPETAHELIAGLPEPHATAALPDQPQPDGSLAARAYIVAPSGIYVSTDGANTFPVPPQFQFDIRSTGVTGRGCPTGFISGGDVDILVSPEGSFATGVPGFNGQVMYAEVLAFSSLTQYANDDPDQMIVIRSGDDGTFAGNNVQCVTITKPESTGQMDKGSLALSFAGGTPTLWAAWQDAGKDASGSPSTLPNTWTATIPLDPTNGRFSGGPSGPRAILPPIWSFFGGPSPIPFYMGSCTPPPATSPLFVIDGAGRGNLWATGTGDVYYTFSDMRGLGLDASSEPTTVRIYVEKLSGSSPYIACIDQFQAPSLMCQGHLDWHDPEMVIDDISGTQAVVYTRTDPLSGNQAAFLASSDLSGQTWIASPIEQGADGDQSHPAIALTNYTDSLDRTFSGTIAVSWYEPQGGCFLPLVSRAARNLYPASGHVWGDTTQVVELTSLTNSFQTVPLSGFDFGDRGVYEYQGVTHLPGYLTGGWMGVWTAPSGSAATAATQSDFDLYWGRWP